MEIFPLLPWDMRFYIMKMIPCTFLLDKKHRELLKPTIEEIKKKRFALPPTKGEMIRAVKNSYLLNEMIFIEKKQMLYYHFYFDGCLDGYFITRETRKLSKSRKISSKNMLYSGCEEGHFLRTKIEIMTKFVETNHKNLIYDTGLLYEALIVRPVYHDINIELHNYFTGLCISCDNPQIKESLNKFNLLWRDPEPDYKLQIEW